MANEGKGLEGLKDAKNVFSTLVQTSKSAIRWLRTGIGVLVLKITLVVLILIFIYILAEVIFDSIAAVLGVPGPGADEKNKSTQFLQSLSDSGYDAMLDANQLSRYYTYEYCVLMDAAEYIEVVGTSTIEKQDLGKIDWESISDEDWARLAAHGFQMESEYDRSVIAGGAWAQANPKYNGSQPADDKAVPAPSGEFYYRIMTNEFTKERALMPYFRIIRNDYDLRYYFEFLGGLDGGMDVTFDRENPAAQESMAQTGLDYNIKLLQDPDSGKLDIWIFGQKFRFEGGVDFSGATEEQAYNFIMKYVRPTFYNSILNAGNTAAFGDDDTHAGSNGEPVNLDQEYEAFKDLYYAEKNLNVTYEVSLRSILDRFLPNASLLSSWRLLTQDPEIDSETGSIAEDLINDILTIYDVASLSGETKESKKYLLKSVGKVSDAVTKDTSARELLEGHDIATEEIVENYYDFSESINETFKQYVPKFDSRDIPGYVSKISEDAPKASQSFTGSFADDIIDDVRLAVSHYASSSGIEFTSQQKAQITTQIRSALSGVSTPGGNTDPINDIKIYLDDVCYLCINTSPSSPELKKHYGITGASSSSIEVLYSNDPMKHTIVKVNGTEQKHVTGTYDSTCKIPFIKVSYCVKDGMKSTAVVLYGGELNYGYIISNNELLEYDENYTNNYAFAHLESGDMKSTTFKHWEFSRDGEESYESWLVKDAFEGMDYKLDLSGLSIELEISEYTDGEEGPHTVNIPLPDLDEGALDALIDSSEIYNALLDRTDVTDEQIFKSGQFAIVRSGDTYSTDTTVPSRVDSYPEEMLKLPGNAFLTAETATEIGRTAGMPTYTDEYGETVKTKQDYLDLKKLHIESSADVNLNISAAIELIEQKIREQVGDSSDLIKDYMLDNPYTWSETEQSRNSGRGPRTRSDISLSSHHGGLETSEPPTNWSYTGGSLSISGIKLDVSFYVIFPTRVAVQPISQRVIDKEMKAYFVKYANYWAAEKDFKNKLVIQGEFKNHGIWHYLVTNNGDAQGIRDIESEYKSVKWRCNLFAPIFGSAREDNSGREADIKLILSEWENVASSGVGAADHAIRDLYALIQYSKGIREGVQFKPGFEPTKDENGYAYVNEASYSFLYVPYEIINYNPLNSEKAFWLDRIICTRNDAIFDKQININSKGTNEARFRSRLPTFTWQVVDYDLYDETVTYENGQPTNTHGAFAMWPFGDQMSRMLYALSANASVKENNKITQWGGTTLAHKAADLYGRTESERIFNAVFTGDKGIHSSNRTMVNAFYGYGYYAYGDGVTARIKAKYVPGAEDVVLLNENDQEVTTFNYGGIDISLDADNGVLDDIDWDNIDPDTYSAGGGGEGLYFNNTPVTLKLGKKIYTFNGTASACYAYELYRQALVLKDTTGKKAEKLVKQRLEKEMKWQEVRAIAPGVVERMGGDAVSGFWVFVRHSGTSGDTSVDTVTSSYCHMKRYPVVQIGQYVGAGTILGYEGTTGKSGGFHCHVNIRVGGETVKPVRYFYPFFTPFWYKEKSEEAIATAKNVNKDKGAELLAEHGNIAILDSDYFSSSRTAYPYGQIVDSGLVGTLQSGSQIQTVFGERAEIGLTDSTPTKQVDVDNGNEGSYVKISNYLPQYALLKDSKKLKQEEDGTDFSEMSTESNVKTNLGKPEWDGESLHTDPRFTDENFLKKVYHNMGRIHGNYPGIMEYISFAAGAVDRTEIWNELMLEIGNPFGVAGMMGNIQAESSFVSNNLNNDWANAHGFTDESYTEAIDNDTIDPSLKAQGAYGLCQWLGGRQLKLIELSKENNCSVSDGSLQLSYLIYELNSLKYGSIGGTSYYPNTSKYTKYTLMEMLQDENILMDIGQQCYNKNKSRFDSQTGNACGPISSMDPINQARAFKTIGASEIILHNFECPGGQDGDAQHKRANYGIQILSDFTGFPNSSD